jgi:predicted MFS family arabinose efflux permease
LDDPGDATKKGSPGTLFLPSLVISYLATGPLALSVSLFLIDIANTFNVPVGVMGQINTPYYVVAFVFALLMGILSIRFRHKSLLLIGLSLISISALGCLLAPDFNMMLASYSLSGLGWAMVSPMGVTLIGEHFPLKKRANAIGWIIAGGALSYVMAPVIALIGGFAGWRFTLLGFVIPIILTSLLLAFVGLPSATASHQPKMNRTTYIRSFKEVLANRSATSCLIGDVLRSASFIAILIYGASFFRQRFLISTNFASIWILAAASCYTVGGLVSDPVVNRFARKTSTVLNALLAGIFTIFYACMVNLWFSLALSFISSWFFGVVASAANSLVLEQVPKFRSTMMSIDSAVTNLGSALGTAVGGLVLLSLDYEGLGIVLGAMGVTSAFVFYFLTIDPTRENATLRSRQRAME